jgi:alkanesulfonate monooxygenase SsuD/methylene tetrahydromethanopterin reductase-like flavin-dependent oxidoreductase (luciferase family)
VKIDCAIAYGLGGAGALAREAEAFGYVGVWTAGTSHDQLRPLLIAGEHTERVQMGTPIGVAFARNPMTTRP